MSVFLTSATGSATLGPQGHSAQKRAQSFDVLWESCGDLPRKAISSFLTLAEQSGVLYRLSRRIRYTGCNFTTPYLRAALQDQLCHTYLWKTVVTKNLESLRVCYGEVQGGRVVSDKEHETLETFRRFLGKEVLAADDFSLKIRDDKLVDTYFGNIFNQKSYKKPYNGAGARNFLEHLKNLDNCLDGDCESVVFRVPMGKNRQQKIAFSGRGYLLLLSVSVLILSGSFSLGWFPFGSKKVFLADPESYGWEATVSYIPWREELLDGFLAFAFLFCLGLSIKQVQVSHKASLLQKRLNTRPASRVDDFFRFLVSYHRPSRYEQRQSDLPCDDYALFKLLDFFEVHGHLFAPGAAFKK